MLKESDRKKLEDRVDTVLSEISSIAKKNIQSGMPRQQVLDRTVRTTVNRLTPESKMLLNSLCNLLEADTLQNERYRDNKVKADYYALDIKSDIIRHFTFEIPKDMNYDRCGNNISGWKKSGALVVVGSAIGFAMKSAAIVGFAAVLAGIMGLVLQNGSGTAETSTAGIVEQYLDNVKQTMFQWFSSVEEYYDEKVKEFEEAH